MNTTEFMRQLAARGLSRKADYHAAAFSRNIGLLSANEQDRLMRRRVGIPGMGGVGGSHLMSMVRAGIGAFSIADMDAYNPVNVNRQYGAASSSFGRDKLETMAKSALDANPHLDLRTFPEGVTRDNVDEFLDDVDIVLDGLDFFVFEVRRMVFIRALERGIPVITAGPMGFSVAMLVFMPGGMGFDEYFDIREDDSRTDRLLKFALGLSPRALQAGYTDLNTVDLEGGRGPSSGLACQLCSALATMEALRILLGRGGVKAIPRYLQFDACRRKLVRGKLRRGNRAATQRFKLWFFKNFLLKPRVPAVDIPSPPVHGSADEQLDFMIRAGIRAPSGDNVQPWRFHKDWPGLDLMVDRAADQSFFNVEQSASIMACGAALENILIAARACGRDISVERFPDGSDKDLLARLGVAQAPVPDDDSFLDAVWLRDTNRKHFKRTSVTQGIWESIAESLEDIPGVRLRWCDSRESVGAFARAVGLVDIIRSENRSLHEHLAAMIRFTPEEAETTRDGLPLRNLEAGKPGEVFLKATRSWSVMRVANAFRMSRAVAAHSAAGIRHSGGVGCIVADEAGPEGFLAAGQALQRAWLRFAHYGIQFQPAAAPALFRLRQLLLGDGSFRNADHILLLQKAWPLVEQAFPGFMTEVPMMFFRVGYGPAIRFGTYRRPLSGFMV
ncbi:ThiF family adenylyltransferase [Salidesulfovibrio brasiliensis]|uniref:ThiF family adenylyltransferase n=1 Tax=Salidesulfovibrio brasiliensis TaxID=221711 RepID=UPI0006D1CF63|nr:ThiF family adenylyltransferase [Salidesulfovibrio brasiliensis]